jgi:hypothetical protein
MLARQSFAATGKPFARARVDPVDIVDHVDFVACVHFDPSRGLGFCHEIQDHVLPPVLAYEAITAWALVGGVVCYCGHAAIRTVPIMSDRSCRRAR